MACVGFAHTDTHTLHNIIYYKKLSCRINELNSSRCGSSASQLFVYSCGIISCLVSLEGLVTGGGIRLLVLGPMADSFQPICLINCI